MCQGVQAPKTGLEVFTSYAAAARRVRASDESARETLRTIDAHMADLDAALADPITGADTELAQPR